MFRGIRRRGRGVAPFLSAGLALVQGGRGAGVAGGRARLPAGGLRKVAGQGERRAVEIPLGAGYVYERSPVPLQEGVTWGRR
ncbi:hypothetical protein [Sorangium sp. So ce363]|uniref:hypothetical protein n=1 Tax=Sorangium sp. So ce363 TaxID=3133304 RepID=UPI003F62323B